MTDLINQPPHYTSHPSGVECISVTEHYGFCVGNAIKYLWRAGLKGDALEDLRKARWYVDREIAKREAEQAHPDPEFLEATMGATLGEQVAAMADSAGETRSEQYNQHRELNDGIYWGPADDQMPPVTMPAYSQHASGTGVDELRAQLTEPAPKIDAEPDAVWDCEGDRWERDAERNQWRLRGTGNSVTAARLVETWGPLTDTEPAGDAR